MAVLGSWKRQVACVLAAGVALAAAGAAYGFGTLDGRLGQRGEHRRITIAALECPGKPRIDDAPGRCLEPRTMAALAGRPGVIGAVGSADVNAFFEDVPHCTGGDFLAVPGYPRTRRQADAALLACRSFLLAQFRGVRFAASGMVNADGKVIARQVSIAGCRFVDWSKFAVDLARFTRERTAFSRTHSVVLKALNLYVGVLERVAETARGHGAPKPLSAKCSALAALGRMLHGMEDFYAHGNWTDLPSAALPPNTVRNPPGLGRTAPAPLLDMLASSPAIDPQLITACYSLPLLQDCLGRVDHDDDLGKDEGVIVVVPGPRNRAPGGIDRVRTGRPATTRGRVQGNFAAAVGGAVVQSRYAWREVGDALLKAYGQKRGTQLICALTHDDPVRDCERQESCPADGPCVPLRSCTDSPKMTFSSDNSGLPSHAISHYAFNCDNLGAYDEYRLTYTGRHVFLDACDPELFPGCIGGLYAYAPGGVTGETCTADDRTLTCRFPALGGHGEPGGYVHTDPLPDCRQSGVLTLYARGKPFASAAATQSHVFQQC